MGQEANLNGNCLTDFFAVTNAGSNSPIICGTNTGRHSKTFYKIVCTLVHQIIDIVNSYIHT